MVNAVLRVENVRGMIWMIASGALFALNFSIIRHLGDDLHAFEIVFFRNLFGLLVLIPMLWRLERRQLIPKRPMMILSRGILQVVALFAWYTALIAIPIATATAIGMVEPILTSLVAVILLREKAGMQRWLAGLAGLAGTLILIRPGFQTFQAELLLPLVAATCWAFYLLAGKVATRVDSPTIVVAYPVAIVVPLALIPTIMVWETPTLAHWGWFIVSGALTSAATYAITKAYQVGDATAVSPLAFMRLVFAALFAFAFFDQIPEIWTWIGGGVVVIAATYLARYEARIAMASGEAKKAEGHE